jgi:hypothetical protein
MTLIVVYGGNADLSRAEAEVALQNGETTGTRRGSRRGEEDRPW